MIEMSKPAASLLKHEPRKKYCPCPDSERMRKIKKTYSGCVNLIRPHDTDKGRASVGFQVV